MDRVPLLEGGQLNSYGGINSKVHPGYGASRLPIRPSSATSIAAGGVQQKIFEGQLGAAAGNPENPLSKAFYNAFYGNANKERELQKFAEEALNPKPKYPPLPTTFERKPEKLPWNQVTRKRYPEHWSSVRSHRKDQITKLREVKSGITLPFSNNIGPGNSIQPARTASDAVAQGHDLHYEHAKTDSDVLSADKEAISQFAYQAVSGTDPVSQLQGALGAVGLGIKHGFESLTGKVLYGNYAFYL